MHTRSSMEPGNGKEISFSRNLSLPFLLLHNLHLSRIQFYPCPHIRNHQVFLDEIDIDNHLVSCTADIFCKKVILPTSYFRFDFYVWKIVK